MSHLGIIRCSSDCLDMVWAALACVTEVGKVKLSFRVHKVLSTTRTLRPAAQALFDASTAHLAQAASPAAAGSDGATSDLLDSALAELQAATSAL